MRRFLPFAALLGVAFVLGCQDVNGLKKLQTWRVKMLHPAEVTSL